MKPNVRLRECTYVHCSGCGAVRGQTSSCVLVYVVLCLGRCGVPRSEGQTPPDPEGWISAVAAPNTLADLLGVRAEEIVDCSSSSLRIPWIASGVGCQPRMRVSCL